MSKFLQKFINATGPVGTYNEEEEKKRQEENESTLDKVIDTAGDIASGISNNYNWVKNTLSENLPEGVQNTLAPFGDTSPLALLFAGLSGANELEHNMEKTYAPTAAEYNYNFGKGAVSGASSVSGGIADIFGAEKTGNEFNAVTNLNKRDKEYSGADNILSLDYITNPDGLVYDAGNMVGSMAALYPSSFLAPATKVTSAAQTLKKLPFLRGLSDDALETMIKGSATSIPESLSEGGNVVRQAKEEGLDDPYLRGWKTAGLNLPALAISNGLEYGLLGGKIFKPVGKVGESVPERMVKGVYRSIPATVATSAQQGLEEYVQQGISNLQTDKEWGLLPWNASQDQIDSLLIGALTGAPMSGAASYTRSITNQRPEQEANTGNKDIDSYINEASVTYGIPTNIIQAQMQAESNFDQSAVSGAGAIGLMQLMPGTAEELGVDPNDPRQNVMGGVKYLKQMYDATGNWRDALIAYNEGLGAWQEGHRYAESVAYADKILNNLDGDIKAPTSSSIDDITINFTNDILNSTFNDDGSMRGANEDAYNFFKDKTVKDSNGNFRFNATDENITALNKKYGEQIQSYRYKNNETQDNLTLNSTNNINKRGNENINATNNNVNINTPNLDKLREFARQRIKTSRNPAEINDLQSLFKNNNEDSQFLDDNAAKNFILRNYGNEYNNFVNNNKKQENKIINYEEVKQSELDSNLVKNINSYRQAVNSGFNRSKNKQNSLSPLSLIFSRDSIQKAQDIVRKLDDNKLQNRFSNLFGSFNENTLNPSTVGGNIAENEVINGTNIPEVEQTELMQGMFDDLKNKQKINENVQNLLQQQATQEALYQQQLQQQHVPYKTYQEKKRREVEQQYANDIYNDTEVPASVGTQARKTENRGRTKANKDILDKFRTTENPILKQGYIDKLAENISNMFSSGYSAKNNKGSLKKLSDFINAESRRNEFLKQLTEEEQNVLMYLDYTFENTGKAFKDVLQEAENERKKIIDRYKDILRSQMKQGVTPRSVAYNRETGEYINSPGYSNNYQWYRDMTANGTRRISKKELEDNLDYIAVEHLTDGYFDPQYGWQIPGGGDEQFHEMEDTINVLNSIATKAEAYEAERFIPTKNKRGVASNKGNVQQTKQSEKIDLIGLKAVTQGLLNRLSEAKENGELQNPSSVNIKKVEKDINSDNYTKQKKAIDFVGNKLDEALPIEEKQSIKENISRTISNTSEINTIIEQNKNNEQAKEVVNEEISKQPDEVEEKQNDNKITKEKKSKPIEEKPQKQTSKKQENKKDSQEKQTSFVDVKTAEDDLLKAFGLKRANTEKHKQKKRVKIVDDSDNALEAEWDKLNKALDNLSANPLFNPEVVVPLFKIGMIYAQRGINNFANFSERMIEKGGERIKPWIKPAWNMTASYQGDDLDENKLAAAFQYVGSKWENGTKSLDKIKSDFEELVGNEQAEPYMQYIEVAHKGAQAYFNPDIPVVQLKENDNIEVKENVDGSTSNNTERDSEGNNKNPVGADNESEGSIRGNGEENNGQTSQDRKGQRSIRVQSSSSDTSRTTSDSTVRKESSTNTNGSTRNTNLSGSIRDSYEGSTVFDKGRTEPISKPSEERQLNEGNLLKQDKAISKEKASRLDDIKHDLPILLPEQQSDVLFAEERLIENQKPGVMFTNGTGTGKTYTGLGILKRFVNQGKKNILIVTPSNDINKAWIDAAKKDFDIKITPLENTNDIGKDVVVTTYANMGYNNNLVNREWDLILCDESHRLMSSEQAKVTASLNNLRALTYNHNGLYERFQRLRAEEYKTVDDYAQKIKAGEATEKEEKARQDLIDKLSKEREELFKQWQEIKEEDKPKVVFLSATPFAYVPNVDYAEGYLFSYGEDKEGFYSYNQPNPYEDFFIKHFGYRMRYNKLTKPDADVNTSLMEMEFHKFLEDSGALSGRILTTSKDYDRGFILVDSGVGAKIDEGIQFLWDNNKKYDLLLDRVRNKLKGNKTRYILEAIKAKSAIDLVKEYLKGNKKVVIFHDFKKNEASNPFVLTKEDFIYVDDEGKSGYSKEAMEQYELFKRERPDLLNLNLKDLTSPINRFIEAFGDKVGIYNGSVDKKTRSNMIKEFNKDNDGLDVILIQRASGKEGISLHDRTGKKQRVLIDLGLPTRPTDAIQCEGRIYRVGVKSNAIFRYLNTGTNTEAYIFSSVIAERSSTAENLALGEKARNLKESFIETFEESRDSDSWKKYLPNSKTEGTGGVQRDRQQQLNITPFERAKSYYYANQKKTSKNKAREGIDYYPTPEPIGYKMVEFADIKSGDSVLEPSAGHGAIARFFPEDTKNVAIEPSSELANTIRLRFNKNGRVIESTFENYDVHNKFNEIVMNPPYGTAAKTAMEHLEKAFNHLRDGGRIVALLPAGNSMGKRLDKWLNGVPNAKTKAEREGEKRAVIMKKIELPSVTFERAGTKVVTDIYIIDKYENEADREKALKIKEGTLSFRNIDEINTLFDEIEDIIAPRRILKGDVIQKEVQEYNDNISNDNVDENTSIQENSDDMFEITDFKHTKTGEIMKRVKVKEQMDFQQLKSLAKQSGGGYSRFAKGFLFSSSEDRQKFINAVRGLGNKEQAVEKVNVNDFSLIPNNRIELISAYALNPGLQVFEDGDIGGYAVVALFRRDKTFFAGDHLTNEEYKLYRAFKDGQLDKNTLLEDKTSDDTITINMEDVSYSFAEDMYKKLDEYVDIREKADFDNVKIGDYEKEISAIGDRMGTPIYWFTGPKGFRGWHSHGTTYLNVNGNWSHPKVFWHETFHWIARNNPSLFNDMLNDMKKRITSKQINDYRKIVWRGDKLSEDKIIEEMMADSFYDVVKRVKYLRNLGKENKSLAKRLISFIRDLMNRFTDFLNNPKARLTTTQKKSMLKNFNNLALSIVDNQGNKLFERGKDGEIKINDNKDFYSISKEEEESLIRQYGEDYMSVLFDDDEYNSQFSADNDKSVDSATGIFKGAFKNIKNRFTKNKKDERIKIYSKSAHDKKVDELGNIGGFESILSSPTRLAEKYVAFKPVLTYADNAMRKLLKNRHYYNKKLNEAFDYLEDKKEDMAELNDLMFKGDALSEEYGKGITDFEKRADKIVEETGVKKGTAKAYIAIRGLLNECYELINRARTQIQTKSEIISKSKLEGLKQNKFVNILDEVQSEKDKDDVLVTYEIRPSHIRQDVCNKEQLEALRNNEAIQILEEKEGVTEKDGSTHIYGDDYSTPKGEKINLDNNKLYTVKYREAIPKVNKLEGYVPHFFHDFYVVVQNDDGTTTTVDSGRNVKEAYKKAEQYLKDNENAKLIIRPKKFDFNEVGIDEEYYAEMVGDGAYKKINERIANEFDMSIDDVEQLLNKKGDNKNKVRRSSKHRFFGNIQHRTGAKGYEDKDLNWVLRHYFNSACRYEALETEFKPKAISYFERIYGRIGTDNKYLNGTARYIKDYINDVNGNPSALENSISTWLNNRRLWRYLFTSRYGERAALSVAGNITNKISILKLGVWNVSSAMLNLTQLLNTTALLTDKNPIKAANEISKAIKDIASLTEGQIEKRIAKLKPDERKAMEDTGVLHELGLDSGAGYSKTSFGKWGDRSMILFKASERLARCATILAAYRKARNVLNKNHDDAVKYARDINRKANFDYGVNDAPNVFRRGSIISQVLFQFMKYPIKQFELMRDFIPFNGRKDATWQQKTTFWGGWIFFAGAFGLPAEDLLWALVGLISEPVFGVSPKQAVRQFLLEASKDASLPERVAIRTLLYGGLSNVGIDISSRVGMNDIIPGLGEDYNKDANPVIKAMEKFGGATGGTIAQFYLNATKGDNLGMLRSISPGMYNIYTAAIGESRDGRGRITTKYDDAMSRIIRGMGFKSTNEAIDTELGSLKYYNMNKTSKEKQNAIDDYLDAEERKENLAPYAKKLKELGVKRSTIVKARKDRKKDRRERLKEKDTPEYYQGAEALSW
jgi:predicted RNA methylase